MTMTNITIQERKDIKDKNKRFRYVFHYKNKRYRGGGFPTKAIARQKAREHLEQLEGSPVATEKTFSKYYTDWLLLENKKEEISKKQYYWYTRSLDLFNEYFGEDIKINEIEKIDYRNFLKWYGEDRAFSTLKKVHSCLSQVFKFAHSEGDIFKDPTYQAKLRTYATGVNQADEDKFIKSTDDYLRLIEYFRSRKERSYLLLFIIAITGSRFSETNKLTEKDLLEGNRIHLRGTKNETSDRIVAISEKDMNYIRKRIDELPKKANGMIFDLSHNAGLKSYRKAFKDLDINYDRTLHSLRHTHCSYLLRKGINIEVVSKRLGHKSTTTTREIYSHILKELEDENAKKIRDLFS